MQKLLQMFKLYSAQVITLLAIINSAIAGMDNVPWWMTLTVNVLGVVVHMIVREIPQPVVVAKLAALRRR